MPVLMQTQGEFVHSQETDAMDSDGFTDVGKSDVTLQRKFCRKSIFKISKFTCGSCWQYSQFFLT